jgi:hypothetical protein
MIPYKGKFELNKAISIFLFILALLIIFGGTGNVIIRSFYGFKPEIVYIIAVLVICGLLVWAGISLWRK